MKITEETKIYINHHGIFFEGEILDEYDRYGCYLGKIQLKKFIVHYKDKKIPKLYFCMSKLEKTQNFTLSADLLGFYYKIPKGKK